MEINELLGNEEMLIFMKEYMAMDKDTLEPTNPIGNINSVGNVLEGLMKHQTLDYIPIDDMPITYEVIDDLPINDENTTDEAYRVKINSSERTINYDMYAFMEHIRINYRDDRFHFGTLLRDLEIEKVIRKDYRGKPNDLFQSRKGLLQILFKQEKEKGYWISRVQYWYD